MRPEGRNRHEHLAIDYSDREGFHLAPFWRLDRSAAQIDGPAVICACHLAHIVDHPLRQGGAPMRTTIFQSIDHAVLAPKHGHSPARRLQGARTPAGQLAFAANPRPGHASTTFRPTRELHKHHTANWVDDIPPRLPAELGHGRQFTRSSAGPRLVPRSRPDPRAEGMQASPRATFGDTLPTGSRPSSKHSAKPGRGTR